MCRVTSVLWKEATLRQNVMRQSTVDPSMVDNSHRSSSSNSKEVPLHPLQDSRKRTISTVEVDPSPALIAVHLAQAISTPFPLVVNECKERQGPMLSPTCPLRWCRQALRVLREECGRVREIWTIRTTPAGRVALEAHPRDPVTLAWTAQRRWCHQNSAWIMMASGAVRWAHGSLPMVLQDLANLCLDQYSPTTSPLRECKTTFHRCPARPPCLALWRAGHHLVNPPICTESWRCRRLALRSLHLT